MSSPTRLAIVGAGARAAAFSALAAGFEVVTADLFADADLAARCPATRITNYPDGLADWLAEQQVDAWMYTGALENYPDLVDRMAAIRPLWGNSGEALRRCRDPFELQRVLAGTALRFPETRASSEGLPLDGSWLCKTYRGSNGSGVWALDSPQASAKAAAEHAVFQERVSGVPASAVCLLLGQQVSRLEGLTEQLIGDPCFGAPAWAYCGTIARTENSSPTELRNDAFAKDMQLSGIVGIDLVIDGDVVWLLEVNPRFPSSAEVAESVRPRSAVAGHAMSWGWRPEGSTTGKPMRVTGKAVCFAKQPSVVSETFTQWALEEAGDGRLADVPIAGTEIDQGQPVLTILEGEPVAGVRDRLRARAEGVYARLASSGAGR